MILDFDESLNDAEIPVGLPILFILAILLSPLILLSLCGWIIICIKKILS